MKKPEIACVIDDDKMFTYILSKQMKEIDFCKDLLVFHNGLEAINYIKPVFESSERLPDVILLDLNMPVMDGWQFLDEFVKLKLNKKITLYIVSSSIDEADHEKAMRYEAVSHFYIKPISKENLIGMLEEIQAV